MHWPVAMNPEGNHDKFPKLPDGSRDMDRARAHVDTYKDMEKLLSTGKTKAIGISNYSKRYLEELLPEVEVVPAVNQIENHPLLPQQEILDLCKQKNILITAYSPLGSTGSPLMTDEHVVQVSKETGSSAGNVLLSYHGELLLCTTSYGMSLTCFISCKRALCSRQIDHSFSYSGEYEDHRP
jgi:glycerol 2-dehydrogenase (NADP+)